jgi:ubiquinone/menaquinone biosynthesis C-methylase UbiE
MLEFPHKRVDFALPGLVRAIARVAKRRYCEDMSGSSRLLRECNQRGAHRSLQARLIQHYSRIADWLDSRAWYQDDSVLSTVKALMPIRPKRVLELCCGTGLLLDTLSQQYPQTEFVGVDVSPRMVELARQRTSKTKNVVIVNQDWLGNQDLRNQQAYDVIIVKNALHLLDDIEIRLAQLRSVSHRWTNLVVIETISPNKDANELIRRLFKVIDLEQLKRSFFTERTLTNVLESTGWFVAPRPAVSSETVY